MAEQDVYTKALSTILNDLENVYGLKTVDKTGTRKLCDLDVEECLLQLQDSITHSTKATRSEKDRKALKSIVHLSFISHRMKFYKKIRLDYSKYPNMGQVSEILLIFTNKITKSEELKKINSIIVILSQIDAKTAKMRNAMGYRFLRIFVVILLNGNISHASVIADFILNQFIIEG